DTDREKIAQLGWGGAAIWYNKIAQINGSLVTAVRNIPQPKLMPATMEYVKREQLSQNSNVPLSYKIHLADGTPIEFNSSVEKDTAYVLSVIYEYWAKEDSRQDAIGNQTKRTSNIFIDTVNAILGTRGLFDMCARADTHPLAQLSTLGKGLVEASIRNVALAMFGTLATIGNVPFIGAAGSAAASILVSVASVTLTMGFLLFYVLPFMPFIYFFFSVGGWIKGIFEAMVGVPLWALAHLRIDGEGMPGDAAKDGYFLIFEIFLRPILTIFGLLASIVIFAAMVKVLNEIFSLVVVNLAGHDEKTKTVCGQLVQGTPGTNGDAVSFFRGPIDELFYTVLYAIIVYMIGLSCFKLIDLIPNNILRYMGQQLQTFNDMAQDPAENLMRNMSVAGGTTSQALSGVGGNAMKAAGELTKVPGELAAQK
ncbi:MAG: type IV secretion protein DotA, partial [Micavibrio aeruginosavorus]